MYRKNNAIAMGEKTGVEKKRKRRCRQDGRRCANEFNLKKSAGGSAPAHAAGGKLLPSIGGRRAPNAESICRTTGRLAMCRSFLRVF